MGALVAFAQLIIVALNILQHNERLRAERADVRASMAQIEEAVAGIRKVQDAHPDDAIDHGN